MQMTAGLLISIALRVLTLIWPLATEALALFWWARADGPSRLPTLLIIGAYVGLVSAPNRFLFGRLGVAAVMLLLSASLILLLRYWNEPSGVPQMIWVHLGFGITWLATLVIDGLMRRKRS